MVIRQRRQAHGYHRGWFILTRWVDEKDLRVS